jgi:predicted dehydrogenase/threonine dehydrogenase-like Zn-dependent dehydrogenase
MKQVVISYSSPAKTIKVPVAALKPGFVLVRNRFSAVSVGTERVAARYGQMSFMQKAKEKPEQVKKVLESFVQNGINTTLERVKNAMEKLNYSGYSSSGVVDQVGPNVTEIKVGDRVACAGGGYAVHAEFCCVPKRLIVKLPDSVSHENAAFATIGAVAMHGFRTGDAAVCERVAVIGLGIIGQLLCQIADAAGSDVIALDIKQSRVQLATGSGTIRGITIGAGTEVNEVLQLTNGRGADIVFICAATNSSEPVHLAAQIARDRGRVVIVGDVGMSLDRQILYDKELDVRVSRSYGPGRYDREYEEKGLDYPYPYVRWTEQRNIESFLELIAKGKINFTNLITHRFPVEEAETAFNLFVAPGSEDPIGVLFSYNQTVTTDGSQSVRLQLPHKKQSYEISAVRLGFIGPGAFARNVLLPALMKQNVVNVAVAATTGLASTEVAHRYKFSYITTDIEKIFTDSDINTVFISTRHNSHAALVVRGLDAGKNVYVEKPLATSVTEVTEVCNAFGRSKGTVMVGFNRRFAPFSQRVKKLLSNVTPPVIMMRVNAGAIERTHWSMSEDEGGGRIIGEGCHFIDLMQFFAGAHVTSVYAQAQRDSISLEQDVCATLSFQNGAIGTLVYTSKGDSRYPKEYIEIFWNGNVAVINDFKELTLLINGKTQKVKSRQDKGFEAEMAAFVHHLEGKGECPILFDDIINSTLATIAVVESCRTGTSVSINSSEEIL